MRADGHGTRLARSEAPIKAGTAPVPVAIFTHETAVLDRYSRLQPVPVPMLVPFASLPLYCWARICGSPLLPPGETGRGCQPADRPDTRLPRGPALERFGQGLAPSPLFPGVVLPLSRAGCMLRRGTLRTQCGFTTGYAR